MVTFSDQGTLANPILRGAQILIDSLPVSFDIETYSNDSPAAILELTPKSLSS
jgi:hypothetical protein